MRLTREQSGRFEREGCFFFPSLFSAREVARLNREVPGIVARRRLRGALPCNESTPPQELHRLSQAA